MFPHIFLDNFNPFYFNSNHLDGDEQTRQGIIYYTPILDLHEPFDIVWDMPPEQFHLIYEGITKQILQRMFDTSSTVHSRQLLYTLDETYSSLQVFTETPRKPRKICVLRMKGSEFATLAMSVFPVLIKDLLSSKAMHHPKRKSKKLWYDLCIFP